MSEVPLYTIFDSRWPACRGSVSPRVAGFGFGVMVSSSSSVLPSGLELSDTKVYEP